MKLDEKLNIYASSTFVRIFREKDPEKLLLSKEDAKADILHKWISLVQNPFIDILKRLEVEKDLPTQINLLLPDRRSLSEEIQKDFRRAVFPWIRNINISSLEDVILSLSPFKSIMHPHYIVIHTWGENISFLLVHHITISEPKVQSIYLASYSGTPLECLADHILNLFYKQVDFPIFPEVNALQAKQDIDFRSNLKKILDAPAKDISEHIRVRGKKTHGEEGYNFFRVNIRLTDEDFPDIFFDQSPKFEMVIQSILNSYEGQWPPTYAMGGFFEPDLVRESFNRLIWRVQKSLSENPDVTWLPISSKDVFAAYQRKHQYKQPEEARQDELYFKTRKAESLEERSSQAINDSTSKDTEGGHDKKQKSNDADIKPAQHTRDSTSDEQLWKQQRRYRLISLLSILILGLGGAIVYFSFSDSESSLSNLSQRSSQQRITNSSVDFVGSYIGIYQGRGRQLNIEIVDPPNRYRYTLRGEGQTHQSKSLVIDWNTGFAQFETIGAGRIYLKDGVFYVESSNGSDWNFSK